MATLVAAGCESSTDFNDVSEAVGAVVTLVDSTSGLRTARTFVLPDTVLLVPQSGTPISPTSAHAITASIRTHFLALGWTELQGPTVHPDVLVLVAASTHIQTGLVYSTGAWGYLPYWGGVDPSVGWGVPGEAIPYAYQAGTIIITMVDVRPAALALKRVPALWVAGLDGMVGDPSTDSRVRRGIDQAFAQSPYLQVR